MSSRTGGMKEENGKNESKKSISLFYDQRFRCPSFWVPLKNMRFMVALTDFYICSSSQLPGT